MPISMTGAGWASRYHKVYIRKYLCINLCMQKFEKLFNGSCLKNCSMVHNHDTCLKNVSFEMENTRTMFSHDSLVGVKAI